MHLCHLTNHLILPFSHLDHLLQHWFLAHKDQEQEESSEYVEAVNDPEEDLKEGVVVFTRVAVVTVDEIVEEGEGPEDAKDGEEFTIQDLVVSDFIIQISIRLQTNPELASH